MRMVVAGVLAMVAVLCGAASAQTAPPPPVKLEGNLTLTSDYRFRGISQSDRAPAIQGTANAVLSSGLYAGTFVSTIGRYVVDGADPEIDLYAGVRRTLGGTAVDAGLLYYVYPGSVSFSGNYFEPYVTVTHTLGPVSAKAGGNFSWKQRALGLQPDERRSGIYGYGELALAVPRTPVTMTAHLGRSFHASYATFGERYTDWSLAAAYTRKRLTLTAAYVDTNKAIRSYPGGGRDRDVGGAGALASIALTY